MPVSVETTVTVLCLGCGHALPLAEASSAAGARCPRCRSRQRSQLFPAALQPFPVELAEPIQEPGEAACFHHPTKRAVAPCDQCGRFLCAHCRFAIGHHSLCPTCIDVARRAPAGRWVSRRLNLDTVSLATATLPMLGIWTTIAGAPAAIYLGARALRQPPGPLARGRWRSIAAIVLGTVQLLIWAALLATIFGTALFRGGRLG